MGEWGFLSGFFESLQEYSTMLGRFWLLLMLVFRMLILGTIASDLFEDEQAEFVCNTLQPGCKQVCYDEVFPISQYRFWVFHIVLIATPSLVFLIYSMHHHKKKTSHPKYSQCNIQDYRENPKLRRLYVVSIVLRILAEVGYLVCQWWMFGFKVVSFYQCTNQHCPNTVDCFTSRPTEKTIFLLYYFALGVLSAIFSIIELLYSSKKWFTHNETHCNDPDHLKKKEAEGKTVSDMTQVTKSHRVSKLKGGSVRSTRKTSNMRYKDSKHISNVTQMV